MNRVLLVNDDNEIRDRNASMLEVLGWEVYVASTEEEVFEFIVACRPAFVVVDIEMTGGAGFESIATARGLFSDLFVIAFTRGGNRQLWPEMAKGRGANDYLVGPVSGSKLKEAIDAAVANGLVDTPPEAVK